MFFREESGNYLDPKYFEDKFKAITKELGVSNANIHATRHTFATKAVTSNPFEITTVQQILGHAQLETTVRYTHALDENKKKLMAGF